MRCDIAMSELSKIAVGGGCHWCTEAVFQSLHGVTQLEQGFISSTGSNSYFSEAVIVHFTAEEISLKTIIEVHLKTHKSTSQHSMREKYRSAVYTFSKDQAIEVSQIFKEFQVEYKDDLITKVLAFNEFKPSREEITNYYKKNPQKPFCKIYITPKLELLKNGAIPNLKMKLK